MRVLLIPYPDTWSIEGGHRTQQFQTARALRRAGAQVVVGDVSLARTGGFDIIHFFGDPRPLLASGRPSGRVVVSPVYFPWWFEFGASRWRGGGAGWAASQFRHALRSVKHPRHRRRRLSDMRDRLDATARADLIVTNSLAEARLLQADSNRPLPAIHIAHNAVDHSFFSGSAEQGRSLLGASPFVLCVGRIEPRKNQLTLARVMRSVPRRLILLGTVLPGNERYLKACRLALPSLLHVPHVGDLLPHVYAAADVHVLPSWYETTGLATLEALAAGTPCVVGSGPCVDDYFVGAAGVRTHRPGDERGLRESICAALGEPRGQGVELAASFNWERTAEELLNAYRR